MEKTFWSREMRIASIALRVTTVALLLISFITLLTNILPLRYNDHTEKVHFYDVLGFKYMLATIILGIGYQILQILFSIRRMKENHTNSLFDFYGDKVITSLLATGAVAGFLATRDKQEGLSPAYAKYQSSYFKRSYASAGLLLLGFFSSLILSVISSYALRKKV